MVLYLTTTLNQMQAFFSNSFLSFIPPSIALTINDLTRASTSPTPRNAILLNGVPIFAPPPIPVHACLCFRPNDPANQHRIQQTAAYDALPIFLFLIFLQTANLELPSGL